ncbi:MAG TPA: BON domain-containing protein [Polyangiales bacterium]|nr:BON domain-containing protein [Polyangiales bacterium]
MRSREFQDWSRDYQGSGRRNWRDRPSDDDGEDRRYRGRESYEQQYRAGQGGMSDMWDRPSYPGNQERGGRDSAYGARESWDQRYRAGEGERYGEPDYDRGRPEPERGSAYGYGQADERNGQYGGEPSRRYAQQNRDFGYGNRFGRDEPQEEESNRRGGFGSGAYGRRSSFGGGAYEGGYRGSSGQYGGYERGNQGYEGSAYGGGFGGGMSLDEGRFGTRPSYGQSQPRRSGNAPKGYKRSDDRIREDVCDRLSERWDVESGAIEVSVSNGEVTLSGSVPERGMKFRAESISDGVSGVSEVHNQLRVAAQQSRQGQGQSHGQAEQGAGNGGSAAESFKNNATQAGKRS